MTPEVPRRLTVDDLVGTTAGPSARDRALMAMAVERVAPRRRSVRTLVLAASTLLLLGGMAAASYVVSEHRRARTAPPVPASHPRPSAGFPTKPLLLPAIDVGADDDPARPPRRRTPDGLVQANQLRALRRFDDAERAYARVAAHSPSRESREAATLASAALEIGPLGRPATAVPRLRALLRQSPPAAVAEEALVLLAEAQRRLGDRPGEAQSLRALLTDHPRTRGRSGVEARLRALDTRER